MILHDTFQQPISWRFMVFERNAVRVFFLGLCVLSSLVMPSYVYASSFSDMLSSLTPSTAASWKGNGEDAALHRDGGKPPIPARKPAWITQRAQVSSEQLLDANGHWNVVEQGREYDPAQAHLNARNKVNTARRKKMESLSPHFKPDAKSGQDGMLRVLQIEPEEGVEYDIAQGYEETRKVSLLQKVFPSFSSSSSSSELVSPEPVVFNPAPPVLAFEVDVFDGVVSEAGGIIVPKVKPRRLGDAALSSVGQGKSTGVILVRSDAKVRMIGGVAIPPVMPARKMVAQTAYVGEAYVPPVPFVPLPDTKVLSDADLLIETSVDGLVSDVVIPKKKPDKAHLLGGKPEFKLVLAEMVGVSNVNVDALSVSFVPVPDIKPKVKRVLENGRASKRLVFVKNLRSGMHPDKTRIVIEVSDVTEYRVTVDGLRNVLRVKIMNTRWDISAQDKLKGSTLLGTYIARQQKDGSVLLEVRLKEKSRIVGTMILRPNISSSHRIVIDLKAL
ncbi:MAG: hypothetical protein COB36_02520 [Alphaproteobacteria bacterium]|nr:MAG: hypothetical protein COB36_02520 [Alphaproteobacteria bacterium]